MLEILSADLRQAVERQQHCKARLVQSVPVKETHQGRAVWEGTVHVFDLDDHPTATVAYAWSAPIEPSERQQFFVVLHLGLIRTPQDAVRAAIVAERRAKS